MGLHRLENIWPFLAKLVSVTSIDFEILSDIVDNSQKQLMFCLRFFLYTKKWLFCGLFLLSIHLYICLYKHFFFNNWISENLSRSRFIEILYPIYYRKRKCSSAMFGLTLRTRHVTLINFELGLNSIARFSLNLHIPPPCLTTGKEILIFFNKFSTIWREFIKRILAANIFVFKYGRNAYNVFKKYMNTVLYFKYILLKISKNYQILSSFLKVCGF